MITKKKKDFAVLAGTAVVLILVAALFVGAGAATPDDKYWHSTITQIPSLGYSEDATGTYVNITVSTPEGLGYFAHQFNTSAYTKPIHLVVDGKLDMGAHWWYPLELTNSAIFEGKTNTATISNMSIKTCTEGPYSQFDPDCNNNYYAGFIGAAAFNKDIHIKNLTFDNAHVVITETIYHPDDTSKTGRYGYNMVAVVLGSTRYSASTLENVTVKNSEVSAFSKVGALIGNDLGEGNGVNIKNCRVDNVSLMGLDGVAPYVGHLGEGTTISITESITSNIHITTRVLNINQLPHEYVGYIDADGNYLPFWVNDKPVAPIGVIYQVIKGYGNDIRAATAADYCKDTSGNQKVYWTNGTNTSIDVNTVSHNPYVPESGIMSGTYNDLSVLKYLGEKADVTIKLDWDLIYSNLTSASTTDVGKYSRFTIGKNATVTLDLGGHTLSNARLDLTSGNITVKNGTITRDSGKTTSQTLNVYGSSSLSAPEHLITIEDDARVYAQSCAIGIMEHTTADGANIGASYGAKVVVKGTVTTPGTSEKGAIFVSEKIGANGTWTPSMDASNGIDIYGNVTSKTDAGIDLNGAATVNIHDGANVSGYDGVSVKRGVLKVLGGEITATGAKIDPSTVGESGADLSGSGITIGSTYVFGTTQNSPISVSVSGGKIKSMNHDGLLFTHSRNGGVAKAYSTSVTLKISGGNIIGNDAEEAVTAESAISGDNESITFTNFITGGYFSSDVSAYVADGCSCILDTSVAECNYKVIKETLLTVTFNMTGYPDYEQDFISGVSQALTPNQFPKQDGYDFLGWNETVENGAVDYVDGALMLLTDDDLTLHAVWKEQIKPSIPEGTEIKSSDTGFTNITVTDPANLTIDITGDNPVATLISDTANITMTYDSEGFTHSSTAANGTILSIVVEPKLGDVVLGPTQDTSARNDKVVLNIEMNSSNPDAIKTSIPQVILALNVTKADDLNASLNPEGYTKYVAIGAMIEGKPQNDLTSTQMNTNISSIEMELYVNASWIDLHGKENIMVYHIADNGTSTLIKNVQIGDEIVTVGGEDFYIVTIRSDLGFSAYSVAAVWDIEDPTPTPYTPSSSKQTGSTIILSEGEVAPTATPTPAATQTPTISPTAKQTTQPTQQSPVPFFGILAGLGAAALVLKQRK